MKIALAVWQERISPVFDASRSLRVVQLTAEGKEERREEISLDVAYPSQRVTILMNQRIEVLICGAEACSWMAQPPNKSAAIMAIRTNRRWNVLSDVISGLTFSLTIRLASRHDADRRNERDCPDRFNRAP